MDDVLNVALRSVQGGALYAFPAIGLNLVYAACGAFNFAHGELVVVGAVVGLATWVTLGLPPIVALLCGIVAGALLAVVIGWGAIVPVLDRETPQWIVSTLGVATLGSASLAILMQHIGNGEDIQRLPDFLPVTEVWRWHGVVISPVRVFPVLVLIVVVVALYLLMYRTRFGAGFRAVADDQEAATMRGISVRKTLTVTLLIAGAIAALGGFVAAPVTLVSGYSGLSLVISGFVAATIGGIGTLNGAVVGALVLASIEQVTVRYLDSQFQDPIVLVAFIGILLLRPAGLAVRTVRSV